MKSNIVIFWILTVYLVVLAAVYTVWNMLSHGYPEWAGSTAILLSGGLTGFIASYLMLVQRKQGGVLVEDRDDSDIDDGDPELGEFSPWSWWPIVLAFGASLVVLGLCIGFNFWLSFLSLPVVIVAVVGWVYEYYRGNFAR
ncbi:aa3-type cytochrome oxidase subunit IV [Leucobacter chromiiresistens]|uniref:Cytochrome c oxidase polypeptide 4 n=1 Tax=Leucobacter chromiiresistens TaxID=1079994 RepID=A0A147EPT2_9MICO|nr:cytochrome c oxidase subunit 4 [Leucobacter chromiiresistens]KTR86549.1 cytochrome c oxidase subunit IV [Leucobacter chromiiresistens]SDQ30207.1 Cytochrome c oxidase subunit IV [Leucobacter chromiiresistens]